MKEIIEECGVANVDGFLEKCEKLRCFLAECNREVNLTRIVEPRDFMIKHVVDSLLIGRFFPELILKPLKIADIGCGAGFPSLILAMAYPKWMVSAIDSTAKKTAFVRRAADMLGLVNIEVITGRSNELNRKAEFKKRFDIVSARAVAEAALIIKDAANFSKAGGGFILYKTPEQILTDLPAVKKIDSKRQWKTTEIYSLPENSGLRQFLYSI